MGDATLGEKRRKGDLSRSESKEVDQHRHLLHQSLDHWVWWRRPDEPTVVAVGMVIMLAELVCKLCIAWVVASRLILRGLRWGLPWRPDGLGCPCGPEGLGAAA